MTKKPLVSVLIPAYNASKTIERAIYSVLNQTFSGYEFLPWAKNDFQTAAANCPYAFHNSV